MATIKKVSESYKVVLTLSDVEARYISLVLGKVWGIRPVNDIWSTMEDVVGKPRTILSEPSFNYESFSEEARLWVENGE